MGIGKFRTFFASTTRSRKGMAGIRLSAAPQSTFAVLPIKEHAPFRSFVSDPLWASERYILSCESAFPLFWRQICHSPVSLFSRNHSVRSLVALGLAIMIMGYKEYG